tara:strand:+ start:4400 stop:5938 length:1539 start_codon:yes stop_codon:yes gene_type:complete
MATTSNSYTGNNSTTDYSFTFPYLKSSDIKVSVDEVVQSLTTHYTLHNATTIRFGTAPATGKKIKIYRDTASAQLAATFYPGSAIRSSDLNDNYTQNLYVTQEAENDSTEALGNSRVLESGAYVSAITKATTAVTTANTASTNASNAVSTANTASSTASTASTNATNAVNTANTASTNATNAVNTANTASSTATTANTTAGAADTKADNAVATANTASTNATNAVSTANTASTNATNAVSTANTASTNATNAVNTANAASASVAAAVLYTPKSNKTTLQATEPTEDGYYEVADSSDLVNGTWTTNSVSYTLSGIPSTFQGAAGLTVRLSYTHSSKTYAYSSYFANDPEERYISDTRTFGPTVTYTVKVATKTSQHRYNGSGASDGFTIDAQQAPFLELNPGMTYKFDQADSSNSGHPLAFYEVADKSTGYTTGVTSSGTPGNAGAYTQIVTSDTIPTILHYQCSNHAYMGNAMQCNTAFDRTAHQIIDAGNFDNGTSTAALSNTYDGGNFDS